MVAGRFQAPARRQRSRPVKVVPALLCAAAAAAAAVAAYSCAASRSFASRPCGLRVPQAARRTAAGLCGSRLPRASRGGEAPEDPCIPFEKLEVGQKYTGTVRTVLREFGAFVDIGTISNGLVHISRIAEERVDNVDDYLQEGQEVEVWISELHDDGKLDLTMVESRMSRRVHAQHHRLPISPGEWLEGTVVNVKPYGAFVKVSRHGATDGGFVHVSELRDGSDLVENAEDEVQEGQKVKVRVVKYDAKEKKLVLSMKQPMCAVGQKYIGTVHAVRDFGAFVDIGTTGGKIGGLVHKSCIADEHVDNIHDHVQEGQEVEVWISKILDDGKLALTMVESRIGSGPRAHQRHWLKDLSPDEWLEGAVTGVQPFGAFVKVSHYGATDEGLVPIGELSRGYVKNVEDEVQKGQRVRVRVIEYDAKKRRLTLSMKQPHRRGRRPEDLLKFEGVSRDLWLTGKVTGTAPYGVHVMVAGEDGSKAAGLVPVKHIRDDLVESFEDELQSGQEVKVRILYLRMGAGRMDLTMK